jgi:hypothetical protein
MSKDGPPSSATGYRFGGQNAFRANLPSNAINPRGPVTNEAEARARRNLSGFADYYARARALGQPAPVTQGVSPSRAAAQQRIKDLEKKERKNKWVILKKDDTFRLKWVYSGARKSRLVYEDLVQGIAKISLPHRSKEWAIHRYDRGWVIWDDWYPL